MSPKRLVIGDAEGVATFGWPRPARNRGVNSFGWGPAAARAPHEFYRLRHGTVQAGRLNQMQPHPIQMAIKWLRVLRSLVQSAVSALAARISEAVYVAARVDP